MAIAISLPAKSATPSGTDLLQDKCPVSGTAIDKNIYADYSGNRIYFDSEESKETFLKNPDQYKNALSKAGVPLNRTPPRKPQKSQKDCATST
jgi:YHS domain-containing protein